MVGTKPTLTARRRQPAASRCMAASDFSIRIGHKVRQGSLGGKNVRRTAVWQSPAYPALSSDIWRPVSQMMRQSGQWNWTN